MKECNADHSSFGHGLLVDFQFGRGGNCRVVTTSWLGSGSFEYIAAAYSELAFIPPGATEVWVELLFRLESESGDWLESRPKTLPVISATIADDSRLILITKLNSLSHPQRVQMLLLSTARRLAQLISEKEEDQ